LTTYAAANQLEAVTAAIRGSIGNMVQITEYFGDTTIAYYTLTHGSLLFFVTQARVIERRLISSWCGYRYGQHYKFEPACKVVSQWTMYAQEDPLV
jgi:hypothetical protein